VGRNPDAPVVRAGSSRADRGPGHREQRLPLRRWRSRHRRAQPAGRRLGRRRPGQPEPDRLLHDHRLRRPERQKPRPRTSLSPRRHPGSRGRRPGTATIRPTARPTPTPPALLRRPGSPARSPTTSPTAPCPLRTRRAARPPRPTTTPAARPIPTTRRPRRVSRGSCRTARAGCRTGTPVTTRASTVCRSSTTTTTAGLGVDCDIHTGCLEAS
jgi:hypothetical protein